MGVYLNPDIETFKDAVNSEIYVDKSEIIGYLNTVVKTTKKYVSVSRPRRFGKSMAADMISAYYDRMADTRDIFSKMNLKKSYADWDKYLGRFDVIHLVMTDFIKESMSVSDSMKKLTMRILDDLSEAYPDVKYDADDLAYSMDRFYQKTKVQFVVVIDEWDAVFRERKEDKDGQRLYLDFLRDWLKGKGYIALAYMTGILPIKKYGKHSALNMFDEYSMIAPMQMARYTGYTSDEVKNLCQRYGRDFNAIRSWYDGYVVNDVVPPDPDYEELRETGEARKAKQYSIYSPVSVNSAVTSGTLINYWNNTESYEALADYIRKDFDGLKSTVALLMDGGKVKVDLSTYQNDMTTFTRKDDILALLIHLGYLGFIPSTPEDRAEGVYGEVFIPNREVYEVFKASTNTNDWEPAFSAFEKSKELVEATWKGDEGRVAEILEYFAGWDQL